MSSVTIIDEVVNVIIQDGSDTPVTVTEQPTTTSVTQSSSSTTVTESNTDVDVYEGIPLSGGGDLHYTQSFTAQTTVTVTHNLGKKPAVTVIDSAGDEVEGEVDHVSNNQLIVTFSSAFSGTIILN